MLRDYQQQMYDNIRAELRTHNGVIAVLPCRSGKSWIMKAIVDSAVKKHNSVLILAHRHLLINQHKLLIKNCRIASVFTEVNHLGEYPRPDLIIIDEAHLSGAESYRKVCEYYGCKRVLFTATASRLDGKPLSLGDVILNGISADELIERGCISPYDLYAPKLDIDLSRVSMSGGDFNQTELSEVMTERKIYGDIIKYYNLYADGRQSIAYCTSVKHSKSVCELFNDNGIAAVHLDSSTPEQERQRIMSDFSAGVYKIICCCNIISEGITLPECDCVLLLRPTQSESLYIQQACRCLTPREGKRAVIIDYVGNVFAHGMPTEKRVYTLNKAVKVRNASRAPEITARQCSNCFKVYKGTSRVCPYCGYDNGKTRAEIKADEKAELERVTELKRKQEKAELKEAGQSLEALKAYGRKKGYKPGWAYQRWQILQKYRNRY